MSTKMRRFVFIDFENLKKVKFRKLEKVCDKLFVLIDLKEKSIPFSLVMNIQRLGKAVKWIVVDRKSAEDFNYQLSFVLGKLHEKVDKTVEFAILSNDKSFDPLVDFVNANGRSCLRVKQKKSKSYQNGNDKGYEHEMEVETADELVINLSNDRPKGKKTDNEQLPFIIDKAIDNELIEETAKETVERLKYSGNRPAKVLLLRDYILLHHQELTKHGNADRIIDILIEKNEIEIEKGEVIYNF